jgi:PTH1 family peptidyl-tRNA hydrolase
VGRPPGRQEPADYVLEPFAKRDDADVALLIDEGADAVRTLIAAGLEMAQERHHRAGPPGG